MTNNGCKRYCEVMNRPAYIVLFKGDDSDFEGNQSVDIVIDTELDTTGMKAHFRFMDFVQDFDSIPENKTLSLVFPNAKTSEFPLGAADATLRFEDASGKFRTVSNRIHIVVTNSVHEAYDNEDSQSITVTVKGTVTWEMIDGKPTFAPVATSGSYNDLSDKPEIPAPVTIDPSLSQTSENPVQNKVVAAALDNKADEVAPSLPASCFPIVYVLDAGEPTEVTVTIADSSGVDLSLLQGPHRRLIDKSTGNVICSFNRNTGILSVIDTAISSLTFGGGSSVVGEFPVLYMSKSGMVARVGDLDGFATALAQKASLTDLPYEMVTPGEWEFSDGLSHEISGPREVFSPDQVSVGWVYQSTYNDVTYLSPSYETEALALATLEITFSHSGDSFTATRASLPGHLLDRAGNRVVVTGDTTLTLPAAVPGYIRDFLVRLEISGSTVPTITFAAPTGETITYETDGDEFPVPDEAGTWLYSFTETAAGVFAVALKSVSVVTQGGS